MTVHRVSKRSMKLMCTKQRHWSAWASAHAALSLRCHFVGFVMMRLSIGWLCWGLTPQSTIFQSCWDGAIASWVINQYFRGVKCLAQGHNTAAVGLEPRTSRSGVRHSTTKPPRSPQYWCFNVCASNHYWCAKFCLTFLDWCAVGTFSFAVVFFFLYL